jgi:hypothetical protein
MNSTSCKIYTDTAASKLGNLQFILFAGRRRWLVPPCCWNLLESSFGPPYITLLRDRSFRLPVPAKSVRENSNRVMPQSVHQFPQQQ